MEKIYDNNERIIGYTDNGMVLDRHNNLLGYVNDPVLMDGYGNSVGYESDSIIYDVYGMPIAYLNNWNIYSVATGERLGRVNSSRLGLLAAGLILGFAVGSTFDNNYGYY